MNHARNTFALRAALMASCAVLAVGGAAQARQAAPAPEQKPEAETVDTVVVTGFRAAYANAIATKRETLEISDGISSDGLGRFPDLNVGEAIQRIPGIQINREADSRNATISLRGLPGTFARTTLNGGAFADPILNGSTPLGAFNSDIFTPSTSSSRRRRPTWPAACRAISTCASTRPWPARTAASPSCPTSTTTWATSAARWPRWATTST
jgi:outer membrane receptor for Fe3+-dicitrate